MHFDKAAYKIAKERIIGLIKDSHDWENTEGFIADGVICPDVYEKQTLRILCILGESYGYDEEGMTDIEGQLTDDVLGVGKPKRWTAKRLPSLLWLIHRSVETCSKLRWEDFPELCTISLENTQMLQATLSKVAWINVKKASRHIEESGDDATRMNYEEAYAHAVKNAEILREQIRAVAPTLIVVCGQAVFNALYDAGLLGNQVVHGRRGQLQCYQDSLKLIELSHPGYHRDWGYEGIYEIFESIYAGIT